MPELKYQNWKVRHVFIVQCCFEQFESNLALNWPMIKNREEKLVKP